MPFSSQPQNKGKKRSQGESCSSCDQTSKQEKKEEAPKPVKSTADEKQEALALKNKIADKLLNQTTVEKAGKILSWWINGLPKPKK